MIPTRTLLGGSDEETREAAGKAAGAAVTVNGGSPEEAREAARLAARKEGAEV